MGRLQALDFYRKIERDLTKGTTAGALLSLTGAVLMAVLFFYEFRDFLATEIKTEIHLDQFEDSVLQINVNMTVERVPCTFLSVGVENVLGTHQGNLQKTLQKWKIVTKGQEQERTNEHLAEEDAHNIQVQVEVPPPPENPRHPFIASETALAKRLESSKLVLVNFYAPWCMWSKKLLPVWQHIAQESFSLFGSKVDIGQADCTGTRDETALCHKNHVTAFPAIVVYRNGESRSYQYHGDRTADAIMQHINEQLQQTDVREDVTVINSGGDGLNTARETVLEGCQISGHVLVKKVPGNLIISAVSSKHSIDIGRVNMTHIVHHLSFGEFYLEEELQNLPPQVTESMRTVSEREYISSEQNQTHEHYLKVVGSLYEYLDTGKLSSYKYTCHSATYHGNTKMPVVKFHYDISPINVVVTEKFRPLYQFITSIFAIIGGIFTVFGILDAFIHNTARVLLQQKVALGKDR